MEVQRSWARGERGREGGEWQQCTGGISYFDCTFDWRVRGCVKNGLYMGQDLLYSGLDQRNRLPCFAALVELDDYVGEFAHEPYTRYRHKIDSLIWGGTVSF